MKKVFSCSDCDKPLAGHEFWQAGSFEKGYCEECWLKRMRREPKSEE